MLAAAFDDLVAHVQTGVQPAGGDVLNPAVVSQDQYGCAFTTTQRELFGMKPFSACTQQ